MSTATLTKKGAVRELRHTARRAFPELSLSGRTGLSHEAQLQSLNTALEAIPAAVVAKEARLQEELAALAKTEQDATSALQQAVDIVTARQREAQHASISVGSSEDYETPSPRTAGSPSTGSRKIKDFRDFAKEQGWTSTRRVSSDDGSTAVTARNPQTGAKTVVIWDASETYVGGYRLAPGSDRQVKNRNVADARKFIAGIPIN